MFIKREVTNKLEININNINMVINLRAGLK